jgi:hypothetical protein
MAQQISSSRYQLFIVGLYYHTLNTPVNGSAASIPDMCLAPLTKQGVAACVIVPPSNSGTDSLTFHAIILKALPQQYYFDINAMVTLVTALGTNTIGTSLGTASFSVLVKNQLSLSINAPNQVTVTIDGNTQPPGTVSINVSPGTHTLSVPQTLALQTGSQLLFDHWSDGSTQPTKTVDLQDDTSITPVYRTQYRLTLTDPAAKGSGWYDSGSTASISVPSSFPCDGISGVLGCTRNFQGWYENGNPMSSMSTTGVTMNTAHTLDTQYTTNMTGPIVVSIVIAIVIVALIVFLIRRNYVVQRRTRRRST